MKAPLGQRNKLQVNSKMYLTVGRNLAATEMNLRLFRTIQLVCRAQLKLRFIGFISSRAHI